MLAADAPGLHVYYVDDHFVPYEGAKPVPKGWNTKRRHAQPGRAGTVVTDYQGRAVCFADGEPSGLSATLPRRPGPAAAGPRRATRRSCSASTAAAPTRRCSAPSATQHADWVTWRRAPLAPVTAAPRRYWAARGDGKPAEVLHLADETVTIKDYGQARQITLFEDGSPVLQVLTSDTAAPAAALLAWLRCRWRIENLFKYLEAHYGIHWLCDYHASIEDDGHLIANPERKAGRARLREAEAALAAAERELAALLTSPELSAAAKNTAIPAAEKKITKASDAVTAAKAALKDIPAKLPASQVTPGAQKAILAHPPPLPADGAAAARRRRRALARQPAQRLPARPRRIPGHHPPPAPPRRHHHLHAPRDHRDPRPARPRPGSPAPSACSSTRSTPPRPACPATPGPSPTSSRRTPGFNNDQGPTAGGLSLRRRATCDQAGKPWASAIHLLRYSPPGPAVPWRGRAAALGPGARRVRCHRPRQGLGRPGSRPKTLTPALAAGDHARMGDGSDSVTGSTAGQAQVLAGHGRFLIAAAARAPSVHNTQPWRFRVSPRAVELRSDPRRKLRADPSGREMLISCGAALFGLRLAVRSLGYLPVTELLPDPAQLRLLARVRAGAAAPPNGLERQMLDAVPHRHTHRGPFAPGPLPPGLLAGLQHDALAEGATLVLVTGGLAYDRLERITAAAARRGDLSPRARAEIRRWTRTAAGMARDGIPATALATSTGRPAGRLPQRDFDLGRGIARLPSGGAPPSATAVLLTPATVAPTGCAPGRPCTGCCCTPPAGGCSRPCTPSRWRTP